MAILETATDRFRETIIIDVLRRTTHNSYERFDPSVFSELDWKVLRDAPVGVIEIKCRQTLSTTYPTVFLAERKRVALLKYAKDHPDQVAVFIASFKDGKVMGINVEKLRHLPTTTISRTKSRASGLVGANDTENAVLVKISDMKHVGSMDESQLKVYRS